MPTTLPRPDDLREAIEHALRLADAREQFVTAALLADALANVRATA